MEIAQLRLQLDLEYAKLRSQFIELSKPCLSQADIHSAKEKYREIINSTRTYDFVDSIEKLLRILEKRGVLSYDNIEVLKYICEHYVQDPVLWSALSRYEEQEKCSLPPHNRYLMQCGKYSTNGRESPTTTAPVRSIACPVNNETENEVENESTEQPLNESETNSSNHRHLQTPDEDPLILNNIQTLITLQRRKYNPFYRAKSQKHIYFRNGIEAVVILFVLTTLCGLLYMRILLSVELPDSGNSNTRRSGSRQETRYRVSPQSTSNPTQFTWHPTQPAFQITVPESINVHLTTSNPRTEESDVTRRVFQEISEKLGRHWRNVARYLRVTEHDIDEIENHLNLTLSEKALKALYIFHSKCDRLQWKSKLKYALDRARRRDLVELVDEIADRKY